MTLFALKFTRRKCLAGPRLTSLVSRYCEENAATGGMEKERERREEDKNSREIKKERWRKRREKKKRDITRRKLISLV